MKSSGGMIPCTTAKLKRLEEQLGLPRPRYSRRFAQDRMLVAVAIPQPFGSCANHSKVPA